MNTHEQYITLTTAKMLKRAGFDWETNSYYSRYSKYKLKISNHNYSENWNFELYEGLYYSAPTHWMPIPNLPNVEPKK